MITISEIAKRTIFTDASQLPEGEQPGLESTYYYDPPPVTFPNATHIAVVEVDVQTGDLKILRYVVVEDCGRIINPMVVDGQIHGGVAQGLGGAILEHLAYDENGQLLATSFMDYLVPSAADVPHMEVAHVETPTPLTPGGFKGAGEGGSGRTVRGDWRARWPTRWRPPGRALRSSRSHQSGSTNLLGQRREHALRRPHGENPSIGTS